MFRYTDDTGSTGWLKQPLDEKQLNRLTIIQLIIIVRAAKKKGLKKSLIKFILENTKTKT